MKNNYVGAYARVSIEVEYLANKTLDEELDTESDFISTDAEVSVEMEISMIEGVRHYSYSNFELTGKGLDEVEEAVEEFISKNGFHLISYDYDIDTSDFTLE